MKLLRYKEFSLLNEQSTITKREFLNAAEEDDLQKIKNYIFFGRDLNVRDDTYGNTALIYAAVNNNVDIVDCLIQTGANLNLQGQLDGGTAILWAAYKGHTDVVKLLVLVEADITIQDNYGKTPLDYARQKGHKEIVEILENSKEYQLKGKLNFSMTKTQKNSSIF